MVQQVFQNRDKISDGSIQADCTELTLDKIINIETFKCPPQIRTLVINYCENIGEIDLSNALNLESLSIEGGIDFLDDRSKHDKFIKCLEELPKLKILRLDLPLTGITKFPNTVTEMHVYTPEFEELPQFHEGLINLSINDENISDCQNLPRSLENLSLIHI